MMLLHSLQRKNDGTDPTYKEWKRNNWEAPLPPPPGRTDPTYKEWKLLVSIATNMFLLSTDTTYKEWKPP